MGQHRQVELLIHLADVVLTGQAAMLVAMHRQPAVALWIAAGGIKPEGFLGQLRHQGVRPILDHQTHRTKDREIMATRSASRARRTSTGGLCAVGLLLLTAAGVQAQTKADITGGPTPAAINSRVTRPANSCPLIVSPANAAVQPLRIAPSAVAAKNRIGCLSGADAIYGPDGCPLKLCGTNQGVIPLPPRTRSDAVVSPVMPAL